VSHSFGGVVVRAALRILQERGQLAADGARVRVVMLAPPNKGSALARALRPDDSASWLSAAALNYAFRCRAPELPPGASPSL
jgi:triacylglycerol esterase/lipase EstA (alpha/beta hydrolase family)